MAVPPEIAGADRAAFALPIGPVAPVPAAVICRGSYCWSQRL
jgi:hypothetical protein